MPLHPNSLHYGNNLSISLSRAQNAADSEPLHSLQPVNNRKKIKFADVK